MASWDIVDHIKFWSLVLVVGSIYGLIVYKLQSRTLKKMKTEGYKITPLNYFTVGSQRFYHRFFEKFLVDSLGEKTTNTLVGGIVTAISAYICIDFLIGIFSEPKYIIIYGIIIYVFFCFLLLGYKKLTKM